MESAQFKAAVDKYWALMDAKGIALLAPFLLYGYFQSSNDAIYALKEDEYTRTLTNTLNQFIVGLHRLIVWEKVIAPQPEDEALELRMEFTNYLLYYMLHQPYEFSSRLVHSATELCHTKGLMSGMLKKADIPKGWIKLESLEKLGKHWKAVAPLCKAIAAIDATDFREATRYYRNRQQHGIPPGLDFGTTNSISRSWPADGGVSFSFGFEPPIKTVEIIPLLEKELAFMKQGFEAYRSMVDEQADHPGYAPGPKPR